MTEVLASCLWSLAELARLESLSDDSLELLFDCVIEIQRYWTSSTGYALLFIQPRRSTVLISPEQELETTRAIQKALDCIYVRHGKVVFVP